MITRTFLVLSFAITTGILAAEDLAQTPAALVAQLGPQSPPLSIYSSMGIFSRGSTEQEMKPLRATARSLVAAGAIALPDIGRAITSLQARGQQSDYAQNAGWLLFAYAAIKGSEAYNTLRDLSLAAKTKFLISTLPDAWALALGLTSYVDSRSEPVMFHCRGSQPQDSLEWLIYGWEKGDRELIMRSLGPRAKAAMAAEPGPRRNAHHPAAIGFKFNVAGKWASKSSLFEDAHLSRPTPPITIETTLTLRDIFDRVPCCTEPLTGYFIDNANIAEILRGFSNCSK